MFVRAYPRETQEMVFDAHDRAFAFFRGTCTRGIYDNMKTAVETVFVGKDRQYNRRFLQMCSHYLVDPVACTPASGWEKGQVENQVGLVRERFFTPRLRFQTYDELNAWLLDRCIAYAKAHRHVEQPERTIWEMFEAERGMLVGYRGPFDGFHALPASVSKTCLVRFDNNKYSVMSTAVGRPVDIHAYAPGAFYLGRDRQQQGPARRSSVLGCIGHGADLSEIIEHRAGDWLAMWDACPVGELQFIAQDLSGVIALRYAVGGMIYERVVRAFGPRSSQHDLFDDRRTT